MSPRLRGRRALWGTALVAFCIAGTCLALDSLRTPEETHQQVRSALLTHLGESLWPYWLEHVVDEQYGGFMPTLSRDGSLRVGDKTLVSQARHLWTFARMWNAGYRDPRMTDAMRRGLEFLRAHFRDADFEGWYEEVEREGKPTDMRKSTYSHAFVIYGAAECYRALADSSCLEMAETTFDVLERHAKDPDHPGYYEAFTGDWHVDQGRGGSVKSMNTHLHLMEAFTELYLITGKPEHGARLREMLDVLVERCYLPDYGCTADAFNADWTPVTQGRYAPRAQYTSYGQNVEMAWLIQRAAGVLGLDPAPYEQVGLRLVDHALQHGWNEEAGALSEGGPFDGPATRPNMLWWVQAEDLTALDWAYRTTHDRRYLGALERQTDWILQKQSDPEQGGWWESVAPDGQVQSHSKATPLHTSYHEVRACLNVGSGSWGP